MGIFQGPGYKPQVTAPSFLASIVAHFYPAPATPANTGNVQYVSQRMAPAYVPINTGRRPVIVTMQAPLRLDGARRLFTPTPTKKRQFDGGVQAQDTTL